MSGSRRALWLLVVGRFIRLAAYGAISVVLALYLTARDFSDTRIGLLLSATFFGDVAISLFLTTRADRLGRRLTFIIGALLMTGAGLALLLTRDLTLLLIAATLGVVSPNGKEVGPFLSLEQAAISEVVSEKSRTGVLAWYHVAGSLAGALGVLAAGWLVEAQLAIGAPAIAGYRIVIAGYAAAGVLLAAVAVVLPSGVEAVGATSQAAARSRSWHGLDSSRHRVLRLAGLYSIDSFGGGFIVQSIVALWFERRFALGPGALSTMLFAANLLAGVSAPIAARLSDRFGLVPTMVFSHLPSNLLLILVPLMPSYPLAAMVFLLRSAISQMDVPTRQSFTMLVVPSGERAAAAGVTSVARSIGAAASPAIAGVMMNHPLTAGLPFIASGLVKSGYDLLLWRYARRLISPDTSQELPRGSS